MDVTGTVSWNEIIAFVGYVTAIVVSLYASGVRCEK